MQIWVALSDRIGSVTVFQFAIPLLSVMIDPGRRGHRSQINQILALVFVLLHVPGGRGQQFFRGLAIVWKAGGASADRHLDGFSGSD